MHFRLSLDLPKATLNEVGGCYELAQVLEIFSRGIPHGLTQCGPVYDLRGDMCGHYLLILRHESPRDNQ